MLRRFKRAFVAAWNGLRRPSRRRAPSLFGLEKRTLLSGRAVEKAVLVSVEPLTTSVESRTATAKANKQATFVIGLYHTYFHRAPSPAQLNYALEQLKAGVSHAALKREIMDAVSTSPKRVSALAFVNALYATIGGRSPTPVGQAYWLGLLNSGLSRKQVSQMFQASNGMLPPPPITWANPASIVYGTPLSSAQLNAVASVPGTFTYSPPAGTLLDPFYDYPMSVTFTPTDSADYAPVSAAAAITVYAAKPTITWLRPHAIQYGTPLSDIQLNATATWTVNGQTVNVPGTFTYSSPVGTVLPLDTNLSLTVVFRPFDYDRLLHCRGDHQHHRHIWASAAHSDAATPDPATDPVANTITDALADAGSDAHECDQSIAPDGTARGTAADAPADTFQSDPARRDRTARRLVHAPQVPCDSRRNVDRDFDSSAQRGVACNEYADTGVEPESVTSSGFDQTLVSPPGRFVQARARQRDRGDGDEPGLGTRRDGRESVSGSPAARGHDLSDRR